MEKIMRSIVALLLLCSLHTSLQAQAPASAQKEEMKKLNFLVGDWKGEGWTMTPDGKRHTFTQTEKIQTKLGGFVLLIEGEGKGKLPGTDEEATLFEALAVVSYDEGKSRYRFVSHTSEGRFVEAEAKLIEGGLEWGFAIPQGGRIRFTLKLTDKGEWFEIGEFSRDEKNWLKFHEMTLQRVK
ncbi:MAG: DUF1579 domain-containing protein [Blastocatellia bacterium]|nr:DUF1579 domain-containing protein [Blastocatellia bacterium]